MRQDDQGEVKYKKIGTGEKYKVYASVPLLKILKENDCVPLLHMSLNNIKDVETDKMVTQFHVGYMSIPF